MPFELPQEIGLVAKAAFEADGRECDIGFQNQMLGLLQLQLRQVGVVGFSDLLFELRGKIIGVKMNVRRRGVQGGISRGDRLRDPQDQLLLLYVGRGL